MCWQPVCASQLSAVHTSPSSHDTTSYTHPTAGTHVFTVHASPSSQSAVGSPPGPTHPTSTKQAAEHPSPSATLPSSHSSAASIVPFPHTASVAIRARTSFAPLFGFARSTSLHATHSFRLARAATAGQLGVALSVVLMRVSSPVKLQFAPSVRA